MTNMSDNHLVASGLKPTLDAKTRPSSHEKMTDAIRNSSSVSLPEHMSEARNSSGSEDCPWDKPIEALRSELGLNNKKTGSMFQLSSLQTECDDSDNNVDDFDDDEGMRLHHKRLLEMMQDDFLVSSSPMTANSVLNSSTGYYSMSAAHPGALFSDASLNFDSSSPTGTISNMPNIPLPSMQELSSNSLMSSPIHHVAINAGRSPNSGLSLETSPEVYGKHFQDVNISKDDLHMHLPKFLLDSHSPTMSTFSDEMRRLSLHGIEPNGSPIHSVPMMPPMYSSMPIQPPLNPKAAAFAGSFPMHMQMPSFIPNGIQIPGNAAKRAPMPMPASPHGDEMMTAQRALLDDFRVNGNKARHYMLEDIRGHVVSFSCDQHGSRFIQQKLEIATDDEKQMVFEEILVKARLLMTDVFGNYVIQKLFEYGLPAHRKELAHRMEGHIMTLSTQMYGCRVIQKALDHIEPDQQGILCNELREHVIQCIKDQNGNHVIQKCIERVPPYIVQFIIDATRKQIEFLATHSYGCRVIQRILEHCTDEQVRPILEELHISLLNIVEDQYGNYVIQHVLEHGRADDKSRIIRHLRHDLVRLSQHKYASNVIEKCVTCGNHEDRQVVLDEIMAPLPDGEVALLHMMRDQFANYVVQKMLDILDQDQRDMLIAHIKPHLAILRKFTYGKHIIAKLEKLGAIPPTPLSASSSIPSSPVRAPVVAASRNAAMHAGYVSHHVLH